MQDKDRSKRAAMSSRRTGPRPARGKDSKPRETASRSARPPPRPLTLFDEVEGRYRLRPGALNSYRWARWAENVAAGVTENPPAVPDAAYISALRKGLDLRRLRDCGYEGTVAEIDDAAIAATATGGIVTNAAFLDIVDDVLFRSSCLCCYYTRSRARAADAEEQIWLLLGYYTQASYESSTAFYRVLCGLLRDISASEADMIAHHVTQGARDHRADALSPADQAAHDGAAMLSRVRGICAILVGRPPGTLYAGSDGGGWTEAGILSGAGVSLCVYSTPEGRKLLRRLGKACKAAGLTLTTRIATSSAYEFFCLRHKLRLYALEVHRSAPPPADCDPPAEDPLALFWECVATVARPPGGRR